MRVILGRRHAGGYRHTRVDKDFCVWRERQEMLLITKPSRGGNLHLRGSGAQQCEVLIHAGWAVREQGGSIGCRVARLVQIEFPANDGPTARYAS
jgi:hypothetical protein